MYQCIYVIDEKGSHDGYLPVSRYVEAVESVVLDNAHDSSHDDG